MTANRFEGIMITLVPALAEAYSKGCGTSWKETIRDLYTSRLYSALEDQSTSLWHLSPVLLSDLLAEEYKAGTILLPEEQ
jgi:hypothetical protein